MSFKERLFGPPWESKDAEVRRRAVASSDDRRLLRQLDEIAERDPDPGVRLAALKRLGEEPAWLSAREHDDDAAVRTAADQAIARSVAQHAAPAGNVDARLAWLSAIDDGAVLRRVAAQGRDPELRRAALGRISSQGFLGDCAVSDPDDEVAAELLARIDQPSTLKRIAKQLRTRHKARHLAAMRRLAELEHDQGQGQHAATDELAAHLIDAVEKIARGEVSVDRRAEADRLEREWNELGVDDPALNKRFSGALAIVRKSLQPRTSSPEAARTTEPAPETDAALEKMVDDAQALAASPAGDETAPALDDLMSRFDRHWNGLKSPGDPENRLRAHFQALIGELQARVQAQRTSDSRPSEPTPSESGENRSDEAALAAALDEADRALESGDVRASHEAVRAARRMLDAMSGNRRPKDASGRMSRMATRLKEMRDWQHWSNNELRERLIQRAEEIDPTELHPDAVTARLKELRERWKELDRLEVLPGEKRRFAAPQGQWRRFQRACKRTFEAARPYLEHRSEVREESLKELEAFIDDGRNVVRDADSDLERLLRYQRAARQAIRNLDALPPKSRGRSAAALRDLMDKISAALDSRFEAVESTKRKLVAEARKLAHESDRAAAIEKAKSLQADWKRAGRGRRKIEDRLWREFREPIDPLFEGLKEERAQRRQAEHEHAEAIKRLCQQAEELAGGDDPEAAAGPLAGLEEEFGEFEKVPVALVKRFENAIADHRKRLARARAEREARRSAHLRELAGLLQRAWNDVREHGRATGKPDSPDVPADDELGTAMQRRLDSLTGGKTDIDAFGEEVARGTDEARQVVVEMECLSGIETPEADQRLRMDYQIERLSNRLGEGAPRPDLDSERAELHRRWWRSFPHDPARHHELEKRFEAADRIFEEMTSR